MEENEKTGEAMPEDLLETSEEIAMEEEKLPEIPMLGLRLSCGSGAKPFVQQFQFAADSPAKAVATEINDFLQMKVELLGIENPEKKNYFRKSDILPRRKMTIDILYKGSRVASSLMNVPLSPLAIFGHEGHFFESMVTVLLSQAQKTMKKSEFIKIIAQ